MNSNEKSIWIGIAVLLAGVLVTGAIITNNKTTYFPGSRAEVIELSFELDKNFEFGTYYFDLDNGSSASFPLCFCLTEKNMFPPDCFGDISYIYYDSPGRMCVPLTIGKGRCEVKQMSSSSFATVFYIPLEYKWISTTEKIIMGIRVPEKAMPGDLLTVQVNFFKGSGSQELTLYRSYEKTIEVNEVK